MDRRDGFKNIRIGQSAAKSRIGKRSTTKLLYVIDKRIASDWQFVMVDYLYMCILSTY